MIDAAPAATTTRGRRRRRWRRADPRPPRRPSAAAAATPARKPNKFMADLTKAMQAAAESARADSLERLSAPTPRPTSRRIHADSANEATELRKRADDDVAAVRDWSKAEIARIREETDERITHRKDTLEREIEEHAAEIEARIERVQAPRRRVRGRDGRVLRAPPGRGRPDPLRGDGRVPARAAAVRRRRRRGLRADRRRGRRAPSPRRRAGRRGRRRDATEPSPSRPAEAVAEAAPAEAAVEAAIAEPAWPTRARDDRAEPPPPTRDLFSIGADDAGRRATTRACRRSGLTPDFAAAEAEAAAFNADATTARDDEIPEIADDALAARLAGLVPEGGASRRRREPRRRRVIVTGLVSVASIAGFKRHLSRVAGVQSVGVSSGPDGEFVFAVTPRPERRASRRRPDPAGLRRPRHRRDRRRPDRRPRRIPSPGAEAVARPAVVIALPADEAAPVATELREAGFTALTVVHAGRARGRCSTTRRDVAVAILDGETDFDAVARVLRRSCARTAGPSRRSWSSRRARSTS